MTTLLDTVKEWISGDWGDEDESSETPNPVYCIRGADIVPVINTDYSGIPKRFVSDRTKRNKLLKVGDIIVEKSGGSPTQSTGRTVYISSELVASKQGDIVCSNFCEAFRAKENWDSLYLYYYLQLVYNSGVFFNFEGKTSGLKNLDVKGAFAAIKMPRIDVGDQGKIANVINIIESKIALNRKKIEKLEALAKTIYDYWFVQFDFPDANGRPYKSSGGKMVYNPILKREMPEEWEVLPFAQCIDFTMGQSPSGETLNETNKGTLFYQGATDFGDYFPTPRQYTTLPVRKAMPGDVLLSVRAPVGTVNIADDECCIGRGVGAFRRRGNAKRGLLVWFHLKSLAPYFDRKNNAGTTFGAIGKEYFLLLSVPKPSDSLIERYENMTFNMSRQMLTLHKEIRNLTNLRDFLLPLLMNGQVEVGE